MATVASLAIEVLAKTEQFMQGTAAVVDRVQDVAVSADNAARKIAGLTAQALDMAAMMPVSSAVSTVLHGVAGALKAVAIAGLGLLVMGVARSLFLGVSLSAGIAQAAVARLTWTLTVLGVKLAVVSGLTGAALFLGMAASAESADRKILGLIGATTPLQDALAKIADAWRLWSDFVAGDFFNMVGSGLGAMASALVEIITTIRAVNDMTGGWLRTSITLVGVALSLYAAWKLIAYISGIVKTAWLIMANSAIFSPIIRSLTLLKTQILAVFAAQSSLNVSTFAYLKAQVGIMAIAVADGIAAAATWAWAAAQVALNTAMTYFLGLTVVGLIAVGIATAAAAAYTASLAAQTETAAAASLEFSDANKKLAESLEQAGKQSAATLSRLRELSDFAQQTNFDALGIVERDRLEQNKINDAANVKTLGQSAISDIMTKEIVPLKAAIERTTAEIKAKTKSGDVGRAEELKELLEQHEQKLDAANGRLKEAQEIVKNSKPLDEAGKALAHQRRIEANLKELNIDVIRSAQETYAARLKSLDTALANQWISLEQYNRQVDGARKTFEQSDPATRERIDAEKRLADSLDQAAKSITDSLKTPWIKFDEQTRLIDQLLQAGKIDEYTAADAGAKNNADLKSALGFADVKTPSQQLADRLYDLARVTKELGTSEVQVQQQLDKMAADIASSTGIGDLFDDLRENKVKKLATAFEGIEALLELGKISESAAAEMKEKAARKFLDKDIGESKAPSLVVSGTTEAYQRDQEVKREADTAQKQLEELKKLQEEATRQRQEQEESRRTLSTIADNTATLKAMKTADY